MAETPATTAGVLWSRNNLAVGLEEVPSVSPEDFRGLCVEICSGGGRIAALFVLPRSDAAEGQEILAVLVADSRGELGLLKTRVPGNRRYPALSSELPQAQAFERELFEEHNIEP